MPISTMFNNQNPRDILKLSFDVWTEVRFIHAESCLRVSRYWIINLILISMFPAKYVQQL